MSDNVSVPSEFARYIQPTEHAEIVTLSRPLVDWLLSINTHNRTVKPSVVRRYENEIRRGAWGITSQGIGVGRDGVLVDGQHRLLAVRAAGYPPVRTLLAWGLDKDAQLRVDTHAKRDLADRLALALDIRSNVTKTGAVSILWNIDAGRIAFQRSAPLDELCEAYERHRRAWEAIPFGTTVRGQTAAFMAACVLAVTRGIDPGVVADFVHGFATGENLAKGSPILQLRDRRDREPSIAGRRGAWFALTLRAVSLYAADESVEQIKVLPIPDAIRLLDLFVGKLRKAEVSA